MISLKSTDDMELVRQIVIQPDIWERIADVEDSEGFSPATDEFNQWILIMVEAEIIGIIYIHLDTNCSIGFHPYLMKKYRKHGHDMITSFFKWFLENIPEQYIKINVIIPQCFESAINFSKKVGFKSEGICKDSYLRKDKIYDRYFLGINRTEIKAIL